MGVFAPATCRTRSMPTSFRGISRVAPTIWKRCSRRCTSISPRLSPNTAHNPGGSLDRRYLDSLFREVATDALGVIRNATEEMREYQSLVSCCRRG